MSGVPVATIAFMSVVAGASLAMIVGNAETDADAAPAAAYYDDEPEDEEEKQYGDNEYADREEDDDPAYAQRGGCRECLGADQVGGKSAAARRTRGARVRARSTRRR
jgi:hypothetical protein